MAMHCVVWASQKEKYKSFDRNDIQRYTQSTYCFAFGIYTVDLKQDKPRNKKQLRKPFCTLQEIYLGP